MSDLDLEERLNAEGDDGEQPEPQPEPNDDDEPEPEQEPVEGEPKPEQEPPRSEKEIEQAIKKAEGEQKRHAARLAEIMGSDFGAMLVCELCEPTFAGFRFDEPVDEQKRQMVAAAIGLLGDAAIQEDDEARQCDRCAGMGITRTGSKVQGSDTRPCTKCAAKGWTTESERTSWDSTSRTRAVVAELGGEQPAAPAAPLALPSVDAWGRAQGSPFYGKNPAYMTPAELDADGRLAAA